MIAGVVIETKGNGTIVRALTALTTVAKRRLVVGFNRHAPAYFARKGPDVG
jgi:hypothetical protein